MTCSIEKVLTDAKQLVSRLKEHDYIADALVTQTQTLHKRVDAMKDYQEDLNEMNEVARHKPRSSLIMNILQENTQIRELQQENRDLRIALEEHQSALELIMSKYRSQMVKLMLANHHDKPRSSQLPALENTPDNQPQLVQEKIEKIVEMANVMKQAINIDDAATARDDQLIAQLKLENNTLRELLHIASTNNNLYKFPTKDTEAQTTNDEDAMFSNPLNDSIDEESNVMNSSTLSVETVKEMDISSPSQGSPAKGQASEISPKSSPPAKVIQSEEAKSSKSGEDEQSKQT